VSTVKANLPWGSYVALLASSGARQFLVSAYDFWNSAPDERQEVATLTNTARGRGVRVFLDSGNYEAYWKGDGEWSPARFHAVLLDVGFDVAFSFDGVASPTTASEMSRQTLDAVARDQAEKDCALIPILHGQAGMFPEAARAVAERLYPLFLAIPERELGEGIVQRAATVRAVRESLDELQQYVPLHLLGTGTPLSIAVYAACGADSFDGLEWSRTCVDHRTGVLLHFHHWDRVRGQTVYGKGHGWSYEAAVLLHNLDFYTGFMSDLGDCLAGGHLRSFLARRFSRADSRFARAVVRGG
jgi:queuine/archaeosine tRNA-ribosyltransferase